MKVCDRCRVSGCLLNYGGKACRNARKQECPDVVFTHADKIREMDDEELAKELYEMQKKIFLLLVERLGLDTDFDFSGNYQDLLEWLKKSAEVDNG